MFNIPAVARLTAIFVEQDKMIIENANENSSAITKVVYLYLSSLQTTLIKVERRELIKPCFKMNNEIMNLREFHLT